MDSEWLKINRIRLGLSQEEMAKKMFVSRQTIVNIESGKVAKQSTILFYELLLKDLMNKAGIQKREF